MKNAVFTLITFIAIPLSIFSQKGFENGKIILNNGDTIVGLIERLNLRSNALECNFKVLESSELKRYLPADISEYWFDDGKYFVSRSILKNGDRESVFLEYLFKGDLSFYYYVGPQQSAAYYVSKDTSKVEELRYEEGTKFIDGVKVKYAKSHFLGVLSLYTYDCPVAKGMITSISKPNHKSFVKLGEAYQKNCGSGLTADNFSKRTRPIMAMSFGFRMADYLNVDGAPEQMELKVSPSINAMFLIGNSSISEVVYGGAGIRVDYFSNNNAEKTTLIRGVISVNYLQNTKGLSPIGGYEMVIGKLLTQDLYLGLKYQHDKLLINVIVDAQTYKYFEYIGFSVGGGLGYVF